MTNRFVSRLVVLPMLCLLSACGGSSSGTSSSPSTSATPAGPTQARIVVTAGAPTFSRSPTAGFSNRDTIAVTVSESAGLGANINFFRYTQSIAGRVVEVSEIGSTAIIAQTGSNRLNASQSRSFSLFFDNNQSATTVYLLTVNFTDDRGNNLQVTFP